MPITTHDRSTTYGGFDLFAEFDALKARTDAKLGALETERQTILREHEDGLREITLRARVAA
jgi:hypothetical protein